MTWYANKKRTDRQFEINDEVFLKLPPYRQASVVMRRNQKLAAKYYEPYKINKRVCSEAYQLNLPAGWKIHNVFNVSQLKKRVGTEKTIHTKLLGANEEGDLEIEPIAVLDRIGKEGN